MKTTRKVQPDRPEKDSDLTIEVRHMKGRRPKTIRLKSSRDLQQIGRALIREIFTPNPPGRPVTAAMGAAGRTAATKKLDSKQIIRCSTMAQLVKKVVKMKPQDANKLLEKHLWDIIPKDQLDRYKHLREGEIFHIAHVRKCMDLLLPNQAPNQHDHSKNELYFFITNCHFKMKDQCSIPEKYFKKTVRNHYKAEPHHPEYEKYTKKKAISDNDIMETAVDRLSRNLQGNQGQYNRQQIEQYYPTFRFDNKRRLQLYKQYVEALQPLVQREWTTLMTQEK